MTLASKSSGTDMSVTALLAQAHNPHKLSYAGDISTREVFDFLSSHAAILADVRTPEEWRAGVPDLQNSKGELLTLSWKLSPNYTLNTEFAKQFAAQGIAKDTPIFFLCRSGGRSLDAAIAMAQEGYEYCFNIAGGFEGAPGGWKAAALPWKQG